jgi:hypothetical protein
MGIGEFYFTHGIDPPHLKYIKKNGNKVNKIYYQEIPLKKRAKKKAFLKSFLR